MANRIVTANRLDDGFVVYRTAAGAWSERLADGALLDPAEAESVLAEAVRDSAVIGPYPIAVELDAAGVRPIGQREHLRTRGPSVRPDLGYQARED
jgi:sulfite reductase (NADPH) hemoprotein beta-component